MHGQRNIKLRTRFRYLAELNRRLFVGILLKGSHPALSEIYLSNIKDFNSSVMETRHKVLVLKFV